MATDLAAIVANLLACVPIEGKRVLAVGAGGGQLVAWARAAKAVIAVDTDAPALEALVARAAEIGIARRFALVAEDFLRVDARADLVLFEFALHEMPDPAAALEHAAELAPEVAVIDHAPGSPWAWYVLDDEKVVRSWRAVEAAHPLSLARFATCHAFASVDELLAKVGPCGPEAERRARSAFAGGPISIPLSYAIARLRGARGATRSTA